MMARLERWKYIPMLVRAYQEAKTRAQTHSEEGIQRGGSDPVLRGSAAQSEKMMVREAGHAASAGRIAQRRPAAKGTASTRVSSVRRAQVRQRKAVQKQTLKRSAANQSTHRAKKRADVLPATQTSRPKTRTLQQSRASLQAVLQELRSTKQQLSQLRAIQMQLNEVQTQLSQQLQVLKGSIRSAGDTQAEKQSTDTEQRRTERTDSDVRNIPPNL